MWLSAAVKYCLYRLVEALTKDPDKLRMIFDSGEIAHLLINSDIYEQITKAQEEQMKDRAEWRKKVFRN